MSESLTLKIDGFVIPETARYVGKLETKVFDPDGGDIVEYERKQKVRKVGDGDEDFVIEEVVEEVSRINRQEYLKSQASEVGVLNILEKVARSGDVSLLNQTGSVIPEGLQDYTNVPANVGEALESLKKGSASFEGLKAIFGDTSFDKLASMSEEEITAALQQYVASKMPKKEEGESK